MGDERRSMSKYTLLILLIVILNTVHTISHQEIQEDEEKMLQQAMKHQKSGKYEKAEEIYKILSKSVNSRIASSALNNLGSLFMHQGLLDHAISPFEEAIEIMPDYGMAHNNLGILYEMKGDEEMINFEKATSHYLSSHSLSHPKALENLQRCVHKYEIVPSWHFAMLHDTFRNERFEGAIINAIAKKSKTRRLDDIVVLDIGAGSGLLSMMAARAGAKRIYACERVPVIASIATKIIEKNGYKDVIHVIPSDSREVEIGPGLMDLPAPADIVVTEILDAGLIGEGMLIAIDHARKSGLIAHDAIIIPGSARVYAQLVKSSSFSKFPLNSVSGFDLEPFNIFYTSNQNYEPIDLSSVDFEPVTNSLEVFDFDFNADKLTLEREKQLKFQILKEGDHKDVALVFWFSLDLDEQNQIDCSPQSKNCHWGQALQYLGLKGISLHGESYTLTAKHNSGKIFFLE